MRVQKCNFSHDIYIGPYKISHRLANFFPSFSSARLNLKEVGKRCYYYFILSTEVMKYHNTKNTRYKIVPFYIKVYTLQGISNSRQRNSVKTVVLDVIQVKELEDYDNEEDI